MLVLTSEQLDSTVMDLGEEPLTFKDEPFTYRTLMVETAIQAIPAAEDIFVAEILKLKL